MRPVKNAGPFAATDPRARSQPDAPKHRANKDTRRWCRGVVGRRHLCEWRFRWPRWLRDDHSAYPTQLQLVCTRPGCNRVVAQGDRLAHDWPTQWGSRHDTTGRRRFYGPGLPPDFGWGDVQAPDYVDVAGAP